MTGQAQQLAEAVEEAIESAETVGDRPRTRAPRRQKMLQSNVPWTCSCAECEPVVLAHLLRWADHLSDEQRPSSIDDDEDTAWKDL
jgi:hypothetical protein